MVRDLTEINRHWLLVHLAYTILELASSLNGGLGKRVKDRVAQAGVTTDELMATLYRRPKLQIAESG